MKKLYKYIVLVIGILAFSACTDEVEFPNVVVEEGNDVILKLNVQAQDKNDVVVSRADNDQKIYDLHIYVFNNKGDGELTGYEQIVSSTGDIPSPGPQSITIRTKTGESYIYAVANINNGSNYYLNDSKTNINLGMKTDKELLNVTTGPTIDASLNIIEDYNEKGKTLKQIVDDSQLTREKFKNIYYKRKFSVDENNLESPTPSTNVFVMSGYINDGHSVEINQNGINGVTSVSDELNTIKLYRILAKNTLTITSTRYTTGVNEGKYAFTPKYYRLCNVPKSGLLIPKDGIGTTSVATDYKTNTYLFDESGQINIADDEIVEVETSYRANFEGKNSFVFYYPENLQVSTSTITAWKDREENDYSTGSKIFTKAPANAAYIEIYGDYVDVTGKITANVSYTIHLGNFSSNGNVKDFNVVRNYDYDYNVDVKGVKDIYVEATTQTDNPYAEGIIINSNRGRHFDVDAHYEARVMEFSYSDIGSVGYILNISTPFGKTPNTLLVKKENNGTFIYGANDQTKKLASLDASGNLIPQTNVSIIPDIFEGEADYDWIKFVKNTTSNKIATVTDANISKYPCRYPGDGNTAILNVFELLRDLYDSNTYTNGKVYYTCFIDENYYYEKEWPEYVDKEPRMVQLANNISFSSDKKSVYADVKYSISQRSICTFYQTDYKYPKGDTPNDLVIAFGTEIIDEEDEYDEYDSRISSVGTITYPTEDWDAWTSAYNTNISKPWYPTDKNTTNNAKLVSGIQPLYTTAAKACMSRNRDLDGDGSITYHATDPSKNEVRWYLAGIEQYRALFYGATPTGLKQEDAYLISKTELNDIASSLKYNNKNNEARTPYHYYTCNGGNKVIFWPEEGLTNNPTGNSYSWSKAELVRCIRTLESGSEGQKKYGVRNPEPFYDFNPTTRTFDLGGIVRTRDMDYGMPLLNHNEQTYPNNLYSSFVVAQYDLQDVDNEFDLGNNYLFDLRAITGSHNSPPNGGWNSNNENYTNDFSTNTKDYCVNYIRQSNVKGTDEAKYQWRTPNQKELALMASEMSDIAQYNYGTRTRFSGWDAKTINTNDYLQCVPSDYPDAWGWNYAWVWHGDCRGIWSEGGKEDGARINVGLEGSDSGVRIRCVRDK